MLAFYLNLSAVKDISSITYSFLLIFLVLTTLRHEIFSISLADTTDPFTPSTVFRFPTKVSIQRLASVLQFAAYLGSVRYTCAFVYAVGDFPCTADTRGILSAEEAFSRYNDPGCGLILCLCFFRILISCMSLAQ